MRRLDDGARDCGRDVSETGARRHTYLPFVRIRWKCPTGGVSEGKYELTSSGLIYQCSSNVELQ